MKDYVCMIAIVIFLFAVGGCIILPNPANILPHHNRLTGKIGEADSSAPIRKGISQRPDVIRVFGEPGPWDKTDAWSYCEIRTTGVFIWLWPFVHGGPIQPIQEEYIVTIHFGSNGRIDSYETRHD